MTSERMIMLPDWLVEEAASLIEQAGLVGTGVSLAAPRLRAALATQPAEAAPVEAMSFEYVDLSGERRTVTITRDDVIECMEDALYEKLGDQICRCEPIGETHVVECNCQDYVEQFTLVKPHSSLPNGSVYAARGANHA